MNKIIDWENILDELKTRYKKIVLENGDYNEGQVILMQIERIQRIIMSSMQTVQI